MANIEDSSIDSFTEKMIVIAENTIPKSKPRKRTVNTVWCNSDSKEAIRQRRKAQKRAEVSPTAENMDHFRVQRAKCRKTVRTLRQHSWQTFVSKINSRTSLRKVWRVTGKKYQERNHQQAFIISLSIITKSQQYPILPTHWATPSPITLPLNTTLIVLIPHLSLLFHHGCLNHHPSIYQRT